jgi:hypothetical protein
MNHHLGEQLEIGSIKIVKVMRIKKFNESSGVSIFDDENILKKYLSPLSNNKLSIHYKCFRKHVDDIDPFTSQTKIGFNDYNWLKQNFSMSSDSDIPSFSDAEHSALIELFDKLIRKKGLIRGIIIDINDQIGEYLSSDEGRGGREFYKMSLDFLSILNNIEDLKESLSDEGYTLSVYISTNKHGATNFSSSAMISLLILDGEF